MDVMSFNKSFNQGTVDIENVVPTTTWPYLSLIDQYLTSTSNVQFKNVYCDTPVVNRYDDLRVSPFSASLGPNVRPPAITLFKDDGAGSTGTYTYAFDETKDQELFFEVQLSHCYKEYSTIFPHIHIATPTQTATNITFSLEYCWANIGAVFSNTTTLTNSISCPPAFQHTILSLGSINGLGKTISSILMCRLHRPPTAGDYVGSVYLLSADFHILIDAMGSENITSK